jgi:hypothetical protein
MNKNGERVNKAQLRENERCLRLFQADNLDPLTTFDSCANADEMGRVQRTEDRTTDREIRKCDSLDEPPPFAYTNAETVNPAAVNGARELIYKIFGGSPVLDSSLAKRADDRETARCQLEILKRADKLENTVVKELNKAKRKAIKDQTVDSGAALEAELQAVFVLNDRITKAEERLVKQVDRKCGVVDAPVNTIFPGECGAGASSLSEVEFCVIAAARNEACLKINAFDDLHLDCDFWK